MACLPYAPPWSPQNMQPMCSSRITECPHGGFILTCSIHPTYARTHTEIIQPTPLPSSLTLPQMHHRHHVRYQSPRSARKEVNPSNKAVLQTTNDQAMLRHAYANAQMECENMVKGTKAAVAAANTAVEK